MLTFGELLYAYSYLGIELDETLFKDKDIREFIVALKKMPLESVREIDRFGEVSPTPISKEMFTDHLNNMVFQPLVNDKVSLLHHRLLTHDWNNLAEEFPEVQNKHFRSNNTVNPLDLHLEDIDYFSFFPEWDKGMRGLRDDDLICIYAKEKMGKSTVTAYLAYKAIENGVPIAFYPTELTLAVTLKYIVGFELGLRGNEALMFFSKNPQKLKELLKKYNHLIYLPPTNIFNWSDYQALYESDAQIIFHDNFVRSLAHLGLEETAGNANQLSRKVSTMQQKFAKATILVTQEAVRAATPKELEVNPELKSIGLGNTAIGRGLHQEVSLLLNIQDRGANMAGKKIAIINDRFRGVNDFDSSVSLEITKRGTLQVEVIGDGMKKNVERAEKMFMSESATPGFSSYLEQESYDII